VYQYSSRIAPSAEARGYDCDEPIGERLDRVGDYHVVMRPSSHSSWSGEGRKELLKGKGDCSDSDPRVQGATCVNCTMELLRDSEGGNILWVAVEVDTLKI